VHVRQPVNFIAAAKTVLAENVTVYVEMGVGLSLCNLIRESIDSSRAGEYHFLATMKNGRELETALESLSKMFVLGFDLNWNRINGSGSTSCRITNVDLSWMD